MVRDIRTITLLTIFVATMFSACGKDSPVTTETLEWDSVVSGVSGAVGSAGYSVAMLSLTRTWKEHGQEGARLMVREGLELVGLAAAGAIHGAPVILETEIPPGEKNVVGLMAASLSEAAEQSSDEWFRLVVHLSSALGVGGSKPLQDLVDLADQGQHEMAESIRLCLSVPLVDALIKAGTGLATERGRTILERIPGWPSPPTSDIMQTLFPSNLARISQWIAEGRKMGGLHDVAWTNIAARLERGLGRRMYDLPLVVDAEPRRGTPLSAVGAGFTPVEVAWISSSGIDVALRPVLMWDKSFMTLASGSFTWKGEPGQDGDRSVSTLRQRLDAMRETALRLEKGVYPTLVGTAMGDRAGKSILLAVSADAKATDLVEAVRELSRIGYVDFRIATPGAPGSTNPVFGPESTGTFTDDKTVTAFFSAAGASIFPNPPAGLSSDSLPPGVKAVGRRTSGYFAPWDQTMGFRSALAQAFSKMGAHGAGQVDLVQFFVVSEDVPAMMLVDAVSEFQSAPGIQFSKIEPNFPGMICPQGRACPGVVPVLGGVIKVPADVVMKIDAR